MPEPVKDDQFEVMDLDRDDPFSDGIGGKVTILERLKFIFLPLIMNLWMIFHFILAGSPEGKTHQTQMYGLCSFTVSIGGCVTMIGAKMSCLGFCAAGLKAALFLPAVLSQQLGMLFVLAVKRENNWTETDAMSPDIMLGHGVHKTDTEFIHQCSSTFAFAFGLNWFNRKYSTRNTYGRYCCEAFPLVRLTRIGCLQMQMQWSLFLFGKTITVVTVYIQRGLIGEPLASLWPLAVFAWKRFYFLGTLVHNLTDTPFKNLCYIGAWILHLWIMNYQLCVTLIGVPSFMKAITFIVTDWLVFASRMFGVMRLGMQTCPKLVTFFVKQQLDNVVTPLPNHVSAAGAKTAMRVNTCCTAMLEGEMMTSALVFLMIIYVLNRIIFQRTEMDVLMPMRNVGIILLFLANSMTQDFMAEMATKKFSEWSYIYKKGLMDKQKKYVLMAFLTTQFIVYIGLLFTLSTVLCLNKQGIWLFTEVPSSHFSHYLQTGA